MTYVDEPDTQKPQGQDTDQVARKAQVAELNEVEALGAQEQNRSHPFPVIDEGPRHSSHPPNHAARARRRFGVPQPKYFLESKRVRQLIELVMPIRDQGNVETGRR